MPIILNDHFTQTMIDMTWREIKELADENAFVILPLGVVEEHGPQLSLGTDTYLVYAKCVLIRDILERKGHKAVIAPPFYWGINQATGAFPGCFTSRPETVMAIIQDIIESLANFGFSNVFGVNHHGDKAHGKILIEAFKEAVEHTGMNARYVLEHRLKESYGLTGTEKHVTFLGPEVIETPETGFFDIHAGAIETAQMLRYYPEQVNRQMAGELPPLELGEDDIQRWMAGGQDTVALTPDGYLGHPADYGRVKVQFEKYAEGIAEYIFHDAV
ncbi:creatininase family protein [Clostridium transplantifaecale]|uniref:creatininase family protein n=1 Tax=Clostridium transplantifaecale TaxID=2479838 RepID=UPI000F63558B|nr:creatininase family protein [Clostridium transplantifaecale]